ncbi:MAG: hypothetical protein Q7S65_05895 [Nanoarchaeota archaeon]|nr:hypothetical protein [Nanoarchaeota archaeon]
MRPIINAMPTKLIEPPLFVSIFVDIHAPIAEMPSSFLSEHFRRRFW